MTNEFIEASTEITEILKFMNKEDTNKIPIKLQTFFRKIALPDYCLKIDAKIPLEQQIKKKTQDILSVLYKNYWSTEEGKREFDKLLKENEEKHQKELREKYSTENMFKRKEDTTTDITAVVEYKEKTTFKKIIDKILIFFHIKNRE